VKYLRNLGENISIQRSQKGDDDNHQRTSHSRGNENPKNVKKNIYAINLFPICLA
jgi:hypothetical protein